jgi:tripartite-type tricarboxylate transporter receptor subunit TctC
MLSFPGTDETMKKQGFDPIGGNPDAFARCLRSEIARWSGVARSAGVKS